MKNKIKRCNKVENAFCGNIKLLYQVYQGKERGEGFAFYVTFGFSLDCANSIKCLSKGFLKVYGSSIDILRLSRTL